MNNKCRKRQRTKSPSQEPAVLAQLEKTRWMDPLKAATSGALVGSNATHRSTSDQGRDSIGKITSNQGRRGSDGSNRPERSRIRNGSCTDACCPIKADVPLAEENSQPSDPQSNENTARTPPKKMLRVRPDGKLGSPKAKAPTQDAKPKRGRKSVKAETASKTLLASIRYGADAQSRSSIGRKVAKILSGAADNPSPTKSMPNRLSEPPKPTHPFFLAGPKRDPCQQELAQSNDNKEVRAGDCPVNLRRRVVSPTKARVTSKPDNSESLAVNFGLGNTCRSDHARISRFPGAMEPLWPPGGIVHVRQDYESAEASLPTPHVSSASTARRKMKEAEVRIPKEEWILAPYINIVQAYRSDYEISRRVHSREWREFRRPLRRIVTGRELQQATRPKIASKLPTSYQDATKGQAEDGLSNPQIPQGSLHPAVQHMYEGIGTSQTAFDKFECETQDWVHKYAPACADQVLQGGREVFILRDWLKALTINAVGSRVGDTSKTRDSSVSSRKATTKRKKRRVEELDGFVVSSDEEANEMCQVTDSEGSYPTNSMLKKSIIRSKDAGNSGNGERVTNAVVISGPHGCGKTAAVHAVARELGFEVFEINAGSRRSGRDILDKVGDMTRNHLVKHAHSDRAADDKDDAETVDLLSEKLKQDLDSGRQGTMNSFFKSKGTLKKGPPKRKPGVQRPSPKKDSPRKHQSQKQSLILLEEVDVLFDEDKTFWATTLELLVQSKRPVIMTCTDESLLPLEDMILYAILRFTPAPQQLGTDYLLLVACNEGHILPRDAVSSLYRSKGSDLRASMTELNFFCQMAIGDTKGGLEWMLIKSTSTTSHNKDQEPLRVVSEGTYQTGMGWLGGEHQASPAGWSVNQETEMLLEAWYEWGVDIGASGAYILPSAAQQKPSRMLALQQLQLLDQRVETFSAADIFPGRIPLIPHMVSP